MSTEIISVFASILFGIIAVIQGFRAQKFQEGLEAERKKSEKIDVKIGFFDTYATEIIFSCDLPKETIVWAPFNLNILNYGEKGLKDSELYITYPNDLHLYTKSLQSVQARGSLKNLQYKLVDKGKHTHMMGFEYGDIDSMTDSQIKDYLILSDLKGTDTTIIEGDYKIPDKNNNERVIDFKVAGAWQIYYYLRHSEGSYSQNCSLHVWNTSKKTFAEYLNIYAQPQDPSVLTKKISSKKLFDRIFRVKRLVNLWKTSAKQTYLLIELEIQKDDTRLAKKFFEKDKKKYPIYYSTVKSCRFLVIQNNGAVALIDEKEYHAGQKSGKFKVLYYQNGSQSFGKLS